MNENGIARGGRCAEAGRGGIQEKYEMTVIGRVRERRLTCSEAIARLVVVVEGIVKG